MKIYRAKPDFEDFAPFHAITCDLRNGGVMVFVTLFGHIRHALVMLVSSDTAFLECIRREWECPHLIGCDYEQDLETPFRGLRAILPGNQHVILDTW
jgi:hypothetical protein